VIQKLKQSPHMLRQAECSVLHLAKALCPWVELFDALSMSSPSAQSWRKDQFPSTYPKSYPITSAKYRNRKFFAARETSNPEDNV
jgi:hypothetical protein